MDEAYAQELANLQILIGKYLTYYTDYIKNLGTLDHLTIEEILNVYEQPDAYLYPLLIEKLNSLLFIYKTENNAQKIIYISRFNMDEIQNNTNCYYTITDTKYYHTVTSQRTDTAMLSTSGEIDRFYTITPGIEIPKFPVFGGSQDSKSFITNLIDYISAVKSNFLKPLRADSLSFSAQNLITVMNTITNNTPESSYTALGDTYGAIIISPIGLPVWGQIVAATYYPNKYNIKLTHIELTLQLYYPQGGYYEH